MCCGLLPWFSSLHGLSGWDLGVERALAATGSTGGDFGRAGGHSGRAQAEMAFGIWWPASSTQYSGPTSRKMEEHESQYGFRVSRLRVESSSAHDPEVWKWRPRCGIPKMRGCSGNLSIWAPLTHLPKAVRRHQQNRPKAEWRWSLSIVAMSPCPRSRNGRKSSRMMSIAFW